MSVDTQPIDYASARDQFSQSPTIPAVAGPLEQLEDGPLAADQVHEVFQSLLDAVAAGSATTTSSSPARDPKGPPMAQLVGRLLKEGMADAQDGDVTGRELKFAVLCNMLVAFMRVQNPAIIANIGHCVEQAVASLVPTPAPSAAAVCDTLLQSFLHTIRLAKVSALYATRRPGTKAVVYIPATNPPLVSDLSVMPDVTFRHCPLAERTHQMDTLEELLEEDVAAGLLPVMVHTVVGMSPYAYSDDLPRLRRLCTEYGMTLSLDGPGLALLVTNDPLKAPFVEALEDSDLKLSLALPLHHILHSLPMTTWLTFVRIPDLTGTLEAAPPAPNPSTVVGLYMYLSGTTAKALRTHWQRRADQARYLHERLMELPCVEVLTAPGNVYTIKWRYKPPAGPDGEEGPRPQDTQYLHRLLCRHWEATRPDPSTLAIHDKYFSYLLLVHSLPPALTDELIGLFVRCDALQRSLAVGRPALRDRIGRDEQLDPCPWPTAGPLTVAAFRFVPTFYRATEALTDEQAAELDLINKKMGTILKQRDGVFQTVAVEGRVAVAVSADPATLGPLFDAEYVEDLMADVRSVIDQLERDDEVMMVTRAEVTKKGIEQAERMIRQLQEEEDAAEGLLQYLPLVRSVANWWSPLERPVPTPIKFDLRTTKLSIGPAFAS